MRMRVCSLASLSGLRAGYCHELWSAYRYDSDLALLWLWQSLAAALIRPLAWEFPYATGTSLKREKKKKKSQGKKGKAHTV